MNKVLLLEIKQSLEDLNKKLMLTQQEVFNAREAADYLRISYHTITALARTGAIEYSTNGTNYIFKKEYLDRWLDKNKRV